MKLKFLPLLFFITFYSYVQYGYAQSGATISYTYDGRGNRIERNVIVLASSTLAQADTTRIKMMKDEKIDKVQITIYPNPTRGNLLVNITGYEKDANTAFYLFSLRGSLLLTKSPITGSDIVDLSTYAAGNYILKIVISNKVSEWKIIKE